MFILATSLSLSCITGVIEVVEGRQNSVTCSGLLVQDTVMWVLLGQNNRKILLGYCPRPSATGVSMCSETNLEQMTPSRTSDTESVLAIDFSTLDDVNMGTLMCQINGTSTNATCQIDVVCKLPYCLLFQKRAVLLNFCLWILSIWFSLNHACASLPFQVQTTFSELLNYDNMFKDKCSLYVFWNSKFSLRFH